MYGTPSMTPPAEIAVGMPSKSGSRLRSSGWISPASFHCTVYAMHGCVMSGE